MKREEAAAIAAAELRTKISENRSEIELLKSQTLKLADSQAGQTAAGMDEMVEKVKKGFMAHFDNPAIAKESGVSEKIVEVQAAFQSISTILAQLASLESTIQSGINKAAATVPKPALGGNCGFDGAPVEVPVAVVASLVASNAVAVVLPSSSSSGGSSHWVRAARGTTGTTTMVSYKAPTERTEEELMSGPVAKSQRTTGVDQMDADV